MAKAKASAKALTKTEFINAVVDGSKVGKKEVKAVWDAFTGLASKELKKKGTFMIPGIGKCSLVKKPATKERKGVNPFTGEPTVFKAKPASKKVRIRAAKALNDAVK